ncbi:hypothetical protein CCMA1212_006332 [Trichoderma ghanense]|uniref:2EXR domain-containing protein n=1 Tax=Trichoderma ghanense TaxID=65468 RepID=A0ABY2H0U8_9HYPO
MSEFHRFGNLPCELRLQIWELALIPTCRDRPGIQFFSVTNHKKDGDELKPLRVQCNLGSECSTGHGSRYCLAASKLGSGEDVGHSWTGNNNPSAYLLNHGLFNACPESRKVAEKAYGIGAWEKALAGVQTPITRGPGPLYGYACVPFVSSRNGEEWRFPVHPNSDLVCLQPLNPNTICLNRRFMEDLCMVRWDRGLRGFRNLAIEYDPSWRLGLEQNRLKFSSLYRLFSEQSSRGFFLRALLFVDENELRRPNVSLLWLVDYTLKRKGASAVTAQGQVFYGTGRNFVEVDNGTIRCYSTGELGSALEFLRDLDQLFCGMRPCHILWHYRMKEPAECRVCRQARVHGYKASQAVRVVACEKSA